MTPLEISNWVAIYAATGVCCAFALMLSVLTISIELHSERAWRDITSFRSAALFVPKLWWRWQKRYLFSTPVTLIVVAWFAATLAWGR